MSFALTFFSYFIIEFNKFIGKFATPNSDFILLMSFDLIFIKKYSVNLTKGYIILLY